MSMATDRKTPRIGARPLSTEDEHLWKHVTKTVRPLVPSQRQQETRLPNRQIKSTEPHVRAPNKRIENTLNLNASSQVPELAHGRAPGLDKRTGKRLNKGRMNIDARLDLHGSTQETAKRDLVSFINRSYARGDRCVLVITGKGMRLHSGEIGVLRRAVPQWLNDAPLRSMILGFNHATPRDGGEGALYVLLKRKR